MISVVSGHASTAQFLSTPETIGKNLDKELQADVVFMDISKALGTNNRELKLQGRQSGGNSEQYNEIKMI